MLTLRISDELNDRIAALAEKSGRTKTYFVLKVLTEAIEDLEDEIWAENVARSVLEARSRGEVGIAIDWNQAMEEMRADDLANHNERNKSAVSEKTKSRRSRAHK